MPKKKEALAQFHQNRILATARQLFAEKGEAGTSMDEIAARAEYSKSTVYVYFTGKEDIFYHLVLQDMREMQRGIADCLAQNETFEARYFAICNRLAELAEGDTEFFRHVLGKIGVDEADFARLPVLREIFDTGEETNRLIERFFAEAVARGEAKAGVDPVCAGFVYWSSICSLISTSQNKEAYFQKRFGMSRQAFLQYGFDLLLGAVKRGSES